MADVDFSCNFFIACALPLSLDCRAMAIGARSQAARTYLEKFLDDFKTCDLDDSFNFSRFQKKTLINSVTVPIDGF